MPYEPLWPAFAECGRQPPGDPAAAIRSCPDEGNLPPPWRTWTLIGLMRHRPRQLWLGEVVAARLGGDLHALAARGSLGHPEGVPPGGLVPGLTDWEYRFHGRGCELANRITGERIDVDFFGPTAEDFDVWFYLQYLKSLKSPEPPEARLLALHPSLDTIRLAVDELRDGGLLLPNPDEPRAVRLAEGVLDRCDAVDRFCDEWGRADAARRAWLAARIGDWPAARDALADHPDPGLRAFVAPRAAACCRRRCDDLAALLEGAARSREALAALADAGASDLDARLIRALEGPLDGMTVEALDILGRRADPSGDRAIRRLLRRASPGGPPPQAAIWGRGLAILVRRGLRGRRLRAVLRKADGLALGEAALLALEHAPEVALPAFRRALRSPIPHVRQVAAAALAVVDLPWSRRELAAVLLESDDHEAAAECRAALRESRDPQARRIADAWDEAHPREPEPGPFLTMRELGLRTCPESLRHHMQDLHDRVLPLRDRTIPEAAGRLARARGRAREWWLRATRRA